MNRVVEQLFGELSNDIEVSEWKSKKEVAALKKAHGREIAALKSEIAELWRALPPCPP